VSLSRAASDIARSPARDTLPMRFLEEPLETSDCGEVRLEESRLAEQVRGYNLARGSVADGYVSNKRMTAMGLTGMRSIKKDRD